MSKTNSIDFQLELRRAIYEAEIIKAQLEVLQIKNSQSSVKYYDNGAPMHLKDHISSQLVHPSEYLNRRLGKLSDSIQQITSCLEMVQESEAGVNNETPKTTDQVGH